MLKGPQMRSVAHCARAVQTPSTANSKKHKALQSKLAMGGNGNRHTERGTD